MATNYLNKYSEPVTLHQVTLLDEYIKQSVNEDKMKSEEIYKSGKLVDVTYFLEYGEDSEEVKSQFKGVTLHLYKNEITQDTYRKYDVDSFNADGILVNKFIEVLNDSFQIIYWKVLDIETNEIIYFEKQYIDTENNVTYEFTYNEDGTFKWLSILDPQAFVDTDDHEFGPNDIGIDKNPYKFSWKGFEYYQFADPIIPK